MLLLASASPARRRLLEQAGVPHRVKVSGVDEDAIQDPDPLRLVQRLAQAKGEVFGKPADPAEALARWRRMAGGWGELHTGHCLQRWPGEPREWLTTVTTRVQFAPLSEAEISAYVASGEPLQCAGGFALEGRGGLVVERIEGCFSSVIGLSLPLLRRWLVELGEG
jgi:septum formation protein